MTRVALVHERLTEIGGSERVVEQFAAIWPQARLFVPVADPQIRLDGLAGTAVSTSWLKHLYRGGGRYAHLLPLLPSAMATARFPGAELVIVSHHAFANRVRPPSGVPLISYTHSPARWIWDASMRAGEAGRIGSLGLAGFAATQRAADRRAAQRPQVIVANSTAVAERVHRWWGREAVVIPPPVDVDFYRPDHGIPREDFFLLAGRLVPYKQPEIAVAAATRAGLRLVVAGEGRSRRATQNLAGPNVEFLGRVTDSKLRDLYRRCRALIFPGVEDFGIIPVEAQACGTPVIALDAGGAQDTVLPGLSGVLVPQSDHQVDEFAKALRSFDESEFDPASILDHAEQFSRDHFRARMRELAEEVICGRRQ
ncbi:MAG: glycosyltransferase [Geodermatophilaceae bacterium]